jgi:hypothetical protein
MIIDCISDYKKILNQNQKSTIKDIFLTDSIDKFKITKQRDGNYPALITISGFTSEDKDNRKDWEKSILRIYPDREWFHLEWNSKKIPFDKVPMTTMPDVATTNEKPKPKYIKYIKFVYRLNIITSTADILKNNYWHSAVRNSKNTGECLAKVLNACNKKEFILIGHSLGARVIHNCLNHIHEKESHSNIHEIHLLGGAVGSNPKKWISASFVVKKNIFNYYSFYDSVLSNGYRIGMLSVFPIGLNAIKNDKVININSSKIIKGHTEYIRKFSQLYNYYSKRYKWKERGII